MGSSVSVESHVVYKESPFPSRDKRVVSDCAVFPSTEADCLHNSLGLPNDVWSLIFTCLPLRDVGRCMQTCKFWRKAALSPFVWTFFVRLLRVNPSADCARIVVLKTFVTSMLPPDFVFIPSRPVSGNSLHPFLNRHAIRYDERVSLNNPPRDARKITAVKVVVFGVERGCGKTCLISTFCNGKFSDEVRNVYRKTLFLSAQAVELEILDVEHGQTQGFSFGDLPIICSKFDCVEDIEEASKIFSRFYTCGLLVRLQSDLDRPVAGIQELSEYCEHRRVCFVNVSAKRGINVDIVFDLAMRGWLMERFRPLMSD